MRRRTWNKENHHPQSLFPRIIMLFVMMIIIGIDPLHAQPSLSEVVEDSSKKDSTIEIEKAAMKGVPDDEFHRGMPRGTVRGFFLAVRQRDFERASEYLDLRDLPTEVKKYKAPN